MMSMHWPPAAAPEDAAEGHPQPWGWGGEGAAATAVAARPTLPSIPMQVLKMMQKDWMATQTKPHGRIPTRVLAMPSVRIFLTFRKLDAVVTGKADLVTQANHGVSVSLGQPSFGVLRTAGELGFPAGKTNVSFSAYQKP